jgi:hypothetical protein
MEAATEADASHYASVHARDHERQGVAAQLKIYPLPWWRRFLDWEKDHSD